MQQHRVVFVVTPCVVAAMRANSIVLKTALFTRPSHDNMMVDSSTSSSLRASCFWEVDGREISSGIAGNMVHSARTVWRPLVLTKVHFCIASPLCDLSAGICWIFPIFPRPLIHCVSFHLSHPGGIRSKLCERIQSGSYPHFKHMI